MKKGPSSLKPGKATRLFEKYEHLAELYARKVFNYRKAGYEYQDILQEFKIKVYTSIQAYGRKYVEYLNTGQYKPIPLAIYLKSALSNKLNDFIRQFNAYNDNGIDKLGWDEVDMGLDSDKGNLEFSFKKCCLFINGIDVCQGLKSKAEKRCFMMYTQGYSLAKLQKTFSPNFDAKEIIRSHITKLQLKKKELYDFREKKFEVNLFLSDQL